MNRSQNKHLGIKVSVTVLKIPLLDVVPRRQALFYPEDGRRIFFLDFCTYTPDYTTSHPR